MKILFFILILIFGNICVFPLRAGKKIEQNEVRVMVKPGMFFAIIQMENNNEFIMFAAKVDRGFKQNFKFSLSFTYPSREEIKSFDWENSNTAEFAYDLHYKVLIEDLLSNDHVGLLLPVSKFRMGNHFLVGDPTGHVDLMRPDGNSFF